MAGNGCPRHSHIVSKPEIEWLDKLLIDKKYRHKSFKINNKRFNIDAFVVETNTIYEFYGDYWHGNLKVFDKNSINPHTKKSYGYLFNKTIERENFFRSAGYTVISMWEIDWKREASSGK